MPEPANTADPAADNHTSDASRPKRLSPAAWLATGLGVSVGVPAPGTVGAIWGVPLWLAISQLPGGPPAQWTAIALLVLLGGPLCGRAARDLVRSGHHASEKDPQAITWDEFTTVPIVYAFAPSACNCAVWLVAGFALHRLFDISKPWPCRRLERLPGGWGIMADDVAAAAYAGVALNLWHSAWRAYAG